MAMMQKKAVKHEKEDKEEKYSKEEKVTKTTKIINEELYKNVVLNEYIYLRPVDLNFKIDDIILSKLKMKVEGKCIKAGYIMKDTINIKSRSLGKINNASFDGMTTFNVIFTCDICNPVIGQIIQCKVGNIDKSQIICYIDEHELSPIEIYLFRQHHVGNVEFASLKIGDIINAKICGSKWGYKDTQINSIAQYVNLV
jgi:DNA-directed RNA polymerase subunit E'/Rpb7